jgi:hypothetical protein
VVVGEGQDVHLPSGHSRHGAGATLLLGTGAGGGQSHLGGGCLLFIILLQLFLEDLFHMLEERLFWHNYNLTCLGI